MFKDNRWQICSDDSVWIFPADYILYTTEMPKEIRHVLRYKYESCIFPRHSHSEILARYSTKKDATKGHRELEKRYNLKRIK